MATLYADVFRIFKNKMEDKDLAMLDINDQTEQLTLWLDSAISLIELDGLKIENDLSDRDNETQQFNNTLKPIEIELISLYMVVAWYDQKINSLEHTLMYVGSKDEKWTSQKDHLNMNITAKKMYQKRAKMLFLNYSVKNNSYLGGQQ